MTDTKYRAVITYEWLPGIVDYWGSRANCPTPGTTGELTVGPYDNKSHVKAGITKARRRYPLSSAWDLVHHNYYPIAKEKDIQWQHTNITWSDIDV